MAVGYSAAVIASFLNIWRATNWTAPGTLYLQLHVGDPGSAGTANVSAGSTARHSFTFAAPSGNQIALSSPPSSYTNGGTNETLTHASVWDASTSGNFQWSFQLAAPYTWAATNTFALTALTHGQGPAAA